MPLPIALAVALLAQATPAAAAAPDVATPSEAELRNSPHWLRLPTPAELAAAYPADARRAAVGGAALIACTLDADGRLRACRLVSESPPGQGFGAAALGLTSQFRMSPLRPDGDSVAGAAVEIPLHFGPPHTRRGS